MKKKYSLDYSIERDTDRLHAVEEILDTLETNPTNAELEQMASYILYGKDENGKNAVQRGETTDSDKRYKSFQRAADKVQSLDEILDNPLADQQTLQKLDERYIYTKKKPTIARPKYDKKTGELIDIGDGDIPGMQELWNTIDRLDHILAVNEGKVPPDENTQIFTDSYRLYQFKHMLIDVRRHQYYLKDAYRPTLHFLSITPPKSQTYNWDEDSFYWMSREQWQTRVDNSLLSSISKNINDYETRINPTTNKEEVKWIVRHQTFDWENPFHIKMLLNFYSAIYMELQEKLDSWGHTLIYDFDRYFDMCDFSEVREYIVTRKIDKASHTQIVAELQEKFGLKYNENHICTILSKEVPEKMAQAATKYRMLLTTPKKNVKNVLLAAAGFLVTTTSLLLIIAVKTISLLTVKNVKRKNVQKKEARQSMTEEVKTRKCLKCRKEKPEYEFQYTPSKFFPSHRSLICTSCLETMVPQDNLGEIDRLCRYLDIPFDLNKWTSLYKIHKDHTLTAYFNTLLDEHYQSLQWADENERWRLARQEETIDEEIAALSEAKIRKLKKSWSPAYTTDELLFLEEYYNQILATQNVSTPILEHYARDLCEIELRIKKKRMREGVDIKKDMDARDNIIKIAHFEATNAKNAADFESVGELMVYYGKKGWHPKWHMEPQDSVDFCMQNIQNYLKRLVVNEGNFAEQVEDAKERYNLTERLENIENEAVEFDETANIEYEEEEELVGELN